RYTVFINQGTLSKTVFGDYQNRFGFVVLIDTYHANHFIQTVIHFYPTYADRAPSGGPHIFLRKTNAPSRFDSHHDFTIPVGQPGIQQLVIFKNGNSIYAALPWPAEIFQKGFFDHTAFG